MLDNNQFIKIRRAKTYDAGAIQNIYRPYILATNFNLETQLPSIETLEERILTNGSSYPFLVAEIDGAVQGFVYLSDFYHYGMNHSALLSIYVAEDCPVRGVGRELFTHLELMLNDHHLEYIISSIVACNQRSIRFHEKNGFHEFLRIPQLAHKNQDFLELIWMRKAIKDNRAYMLNFAPTFNLEMDLTSALHHNLVNIDS